MMNPGPSEELGHTARNVVDALKQQPLVLLMFLVNVLFMVLIFISVRENSSRADDMIKELTHLVAACPAPLELPRK